jgi:hypothetical protein
MVDRLKTSAPIAVAIERAQPRGDRGTPAPLPLPAASIHAAGFPTFQRLPKVTSRALLTTSVLWPALHSRRASPYVLFALFGVLCSDLGLGLYNYYY